MESELFDNIIDIAYYLNKKLNELEIKNYYSNIPSELNTNLSNIINNLLEYISDNDAQEISLERTGLFLSYLNNLIDGKNKIIIILKDKF